MTSPIYGHPTQDTLLHYANRDLSMGEREAVERHIAQCPPCRQVVEALSSGHLIDRIRGAHRDPDSAMTRDTEAHGPGGQDDTSEGLSIGPNPASSNLPEIVGYQTIRKLGEGGMGRVYLVKNLLMDREEAMKVIKDRVNDPDMIERFRNEIKVVAKLQHPNIVKAYSATEHDGLVCLFMEYSEGMDLNRYIVDKGTMTWKSACGVIGQVARGLRSANEQNVVHRDIKPSNLISTKVQDKSVVKILDFGLARLIPDQMVIDPETGKHSMGQKIVGTPHFMSPEQIFNSDRLDIRADIYSLGCTFYFLLTGRTPFQDARGTQGILVAHMTQQPMPLRELRDDLPLGLPEIVEKMMEKDPNYRFQTPIELESALMMLLNGQKVSSPRPSQSLAPPATHLKPSSPARTHRCPSCRQDVFIREGIAAQVDFCPHCRESFNPVAPQRPLSSHQTTPPAGHPDPMPQQSAEAKEPTSHDPEFGKISENPEVPEGWNVRFGDIGLALTLKLVR